MKIEEKIKEKYRELGRLDENYSVWLTRRAPFWRIGFDYNLSVATGNDPKKVVFNYCEDPLDVWYRELRKNKRAQLSIYTRTWLTWNEAEDLRDKIVAAGGKAVIEKLRSAEVLADMRSMLEREIWQLEQKLAVQKAENRRKAAESRAAAVEKGVVSPERLALVESFFSGRDVEYGFNKDGEVDVYGDVTLTADDLVNDEIPFSFGKVEGSFDCSALALETLRNAPYWVGGDFDCSENMLEDLEFCPSHVGGDFVCTDNGEYPDFSADSVDYLGGEFICDPTLEDL